MRSRSLAVVVSVCFAFVAGANAQLAESDSPSEGDNRPAAPAPLTPGTSEEAPPVDNSSHSSSLLESFGRKAALGPISLGR